MKLVNVRADGKHATQYVKSILTRFEHLTIHSHMHPPAALRYLKIHSRNCKKYTAYIYSQFTVIDCVTCATVIWQ